MFDRTKITIRSGKGGDGVVTFRREKFVPLGGPDGGDGGDGGDVVFKVDPNEDTLKKYYYRKEYNAENGQPGQSKKKYGKSGKTLELPVPPGTVITDITDEQNPFVAADMDEPNQQLLAAKGGRGGLGNVHFSTSTNQTPRLASKGSPGQEKHLLLELKLIADVGIIGLPNAGKSSLLSASSGAKPKVGAYPFTTLQPELGTVATGQTVFIMADIPGLIEGAAEGKGLGHEFLRHIVRTRLLVHLLDGTSDDPMRDFNLVNRELAVYDRELTRKKQMAVINKIDLPEVAGRTAELIHRFATEGIQLDFISALTGEGVKGLTDKISRQLARIQPDDVKSEVAPVKVFKPGPARAGVDIEKQEGCYIIHDFDLERIAGGSDISDGEVRRQLWGLIEKRASAKTLQKMGIQPGDVIKLGDFEWRW